MEIYIIAIFAAILTLTPTMLSRFLYSKKECIPNTDSMKKDDDLWLEEEKSKPRYCISFTTNNGYKTKFINGFAPKNSKSGSRGNVRITSKRRAEIYLAFCFKRGFFLDGDGVYHPIHTIDSAKLEIEDEN